MTRLTLEALIVNKIRLARQTKDTFADKGAVWQAAHAEEILLTDLLQRSGNTHLIPPTE